jgi:hypothetical protein
VGLFVASTLGCGSIESRDATQQLLLSNAIDRSIASIDFHPLAGKKVFLDTQYAKNVKTVGFVNSEYVISSLRQQMIASRCLLQESMAEADLIVEARIGTLGADDHEVTYGLPAANGLGSASSIVTQLPALPSIPEISVAKKRDQTAAAKIGLFAYDRQTREPYWQSGLSQTKSTAKDIWVLGAGPFQQGTIYDRTQFAGADLPAQVIGGDDEDEEVPRTMMAAYAKTRRFDPPPPEDEDVELATHNEDEPPPSGDPNAVSDTK